MAPFELKDVDSDGQFSGWGSVFGVIDSHGDIVARGAFKETLAEAAAKKTLPHLLLQHALGVTTADEMPVGVWTKMVETDYGLWCEGKLSLDNSRGRDAWALMKMQPRSAIDGLSIGYSATKYEIHPKSSKARRTLLSVKLFEVSLVTDPSCSVARVKDVKRLPGLTIRDREAEFRALGYSRSVSKKLARAATDDDEFRDSMSNLADSIRRAAS